MNTRHAQIVFEPLVDDVLAAFSDHLERGGPRPPLDHLDSHDRQLAENLMRLMETGRGIDPSASAPSLEELLAGTEFMDAEGSVLSSGDVVNDRDDVDEGE